MEHRDVSKNNPRDRSDAPKAFPNGANSRAPLDLLAIDLSSELPSAAGWDAAPGAEREAPFEAELVGAPSEIGDDPFAEPVAVSAGPMIAVVAPVNPPSELVQATMAAGPNGVSAKENATSALAVVGEEAKPLTQFDLVRRRFYLTALPSWAISLGVHVAVLFLLAALSMAPIQETIGTALDAGGGNEGESLDDIELPGQDDSIEAEASEEPFATTSPMVSEVVTMPEITTTSVSTAPSLNALSMNGATESVLPSSMLGSTMGRMTTSLNGRSAGMKGEMLERFGGNAASEKSVAAALKWIAEHQAPNGGWSFGCSRFCRGQCKGDGRMVEAVNGATAMALLPFLGAGQTHLQGKYKDTIKKGLAFLIQNMKTTPGNLPHGSWHEPGGRMYSHGLAAITICEAYAMTRDPDLVQPAQLAINYLVYAQDPRGGGWRYEPHEAGDTSVVGWCVMALKSGAMGNLTVPQTSFRGASQFLDFVSTNNGAYYGYDKPTSNNAGRQATIAVGLLCRMYMGWSQDNEAIKEGVAFLDQTGPSVDDLYYSYYATQVMRHQGGPIWEKWNTKLRDELIKTQSGIGHEAGSWYMAGGHGQEGGRLYSTSLATMILEVYYRHMPLYSEKSADDEFEL